MLNFLGNFSDSFLLAIFLWPFIALFLTLPILLWQYIRFHHLPKGRVALIYLFMLYALALVAFTLYPFPDNPTKFCADYNLSPQLNPIQFIFDIQEDGLRAVLQICMNILFFVPLGVFLKNLLGRKIISTIVIALLVSLFIETAQLTGVFGAFPCGYRLFDVDDIALNIIGAVLGFLLALALPDLSKPKKREEVNTHPGLTHRFVAYIADMLILHLATLVVLAPLFLFAGGSDTIWHYADIVITATLFVLLQFIEPLIFKGQTAFGRLTGITIDDHQRSSLNRFLLYSVRALLIAGVIFWPFSNSIPTIIVIVTLIYWLITKKLPYTIVDVFFREPKPASKKKQ